MTLGQMFLGIMYTGMVCGVAGFGTLTVLMGSAFDIWAKYIWMVPALGILGCILFIIGVLGFLLTGTVSELMRYF